MAYWTYQAFILIKPYLSVTDSYVAAYSIGAFLKFGKALNLDSSYMNSNTSLNNTSLPKNISS